MNATPMRAQHTVPLRSRGNAYYPFQLYYGCVQLSEWPIDSAYIIPYNVITSMLQVRLKQRRNKSLEGPQGLSRLFVMSWAVIL